MPIQIPDELITQIYLGHTVLFVGSGLSAGAGFPDWGKLMTAMLKWAENKGVDLSGNKRELRELLKQHQYLLVAEELRDQIGNVRFRDFMQSVFRDDSKSSSKVHRILPELPFSAVLTTNYDTLLESAYSNYWGTVPSVYTQDDVAEMAELGRKNGFFILKTHGNIDRIDTIILGQNDYRQIMFGNRAYRELLESLLMSRTVFFIGFSLTDPDLILLFEELGFALKGYNGSHFALMESKQIGPIRRKFLEKDYGIQVIPYQASKGHPEVYDFLVSIANHVADRFVSQIAPRVWSGLPHRNFTVEQLNRREAELLVSKLEHLVIEQPRGHELVLVRIDMEGLGQADFFRKLGAALGQIVQVHYPELQLPWNESDTSSLDFLHFVQNLTLKLEKSATPPVRIILLLMHADSMNTFDTGIKYDFRNVLENSQSHLGAIILARKLDREWLSQNSPWLNIFEPIHKEPAVFEG